MHVPHRHGCFTAWLYLIIIGGTFGLLVLLLDSKFAYRPVRHEPPPLFILLIVGCMVSSMACAGYLFLLKRWGFYGYVITNVVLCVGNFVAGNDVGHSLLPLFWVLCMIGVMQIGGRYKAWGRLR